MLTANEVIDKTYDLLLAQGSMSINIKKESDSVYLRFCQYRMKGSDNKCAAGHWIPDDKYKKEMEGVKASADIVLNALPELEDIKGDQVPKFWAALQYNMHDRCPNGYEGPIWKEFLDEGRASMKAMLPLS